MLIYFADYIHLSVLLQLDRVSWWSHAISGRFINGQIVLQKKKPSQLIRYSTTFPYGGKPSSNKISGMIHTSSFRLQCPWNIQDYLSHLLSVSPQKNTTEQLCWFRVFGMSNIKRFLIGTVLPSYVYDGYLVWIEKMLTT